jgi:cysteine synthase A
MKIANNITELIGNTPLVKIQKLGEGLQAEIVAKLEMFNPMSSVKDRAALAMIEDAEKKKVLHVGSIIVEPTSGNMGVGMAYIAAYKGYRIILVMPESMSLERRSLLRSLGAELVLTPAVLGMSGARQKATEIVSENSNAVMLQQFDNPANPKAHQLTTAQEIWNDTEGKVDIVVVGVGSGGTVTGLGQGLKAHNPAIRIVAIEPETSAVISGESACLHRIQGLGAGFIPSNYKGEFVDEVMKVPNEMAYDMTRKLAKHEGLFVGISSGAAFWAAMQLAEKKENKGKRIVVIFPDSGERYLSVEGLFQ